MPTEGSPRYTRTSTSESVSMITPGPFRVQQLLLPLPYTLALQLGVLLSALRDYQHGSTGIEHSSFSIPSQFLITTHNLLLISAM